MESQINQQEHINPPLTLKNKALSVDAKGLVKKPRISFKELVHKQLDLEKEVKAQRDTQIIGGIVFIVAFIGFLICLLGFKAFLCLVIALAGLAIYIAKTLKIIYLRGPMNYLSPGLQNLLLNRSILDIMCDLWFIPKITLYVGAFVKPFLYHMTPEEAREMMHKLPNPNFGHAVSKKGILNLFPSKVGEVLTHNSAFLVEKQKKEESKQLRRSFRQQSKAKKSKPVIRMDDEPPQVKRAARALPPKAPSKQTYKSTDKDLPLKKFQTQENIEEESKDSTTSTPVKQQHRDPMTEAEQQFFTDSEIEHFWDNHTEFKKKEEEEKGADEGTGPQPKLKIAHKLDLHTKLDNISKKLNPEAIKGKVAQFKHNLKESFMKKYSLTKSLLLFTFMAAIFIVKARYHPKFAKQAKRLLHILWFSGMSLGLLYSMVILIIRIKSGGGKGDKEDKVVKVKKVLEELSVASDEE